MAWILFGNIKNLKIKEITLLIKMTPQKIDSANFENS
jgi:hypothetical protein